MKSDRSRGHAAKAQTPGQAGPTSAGLLEEIRIESEVASLALTRLTRERQAFHILTEAAVSPAELTEICQKVLTDLLDVLGFDFATLRLYDPDSRLLNLAALAGTTALTLSDRFPPQPIDDPHYIAAYVARAAQPVYAPSLDNHPIAASHGARIAELGLKGIIAYPITTAGGELIGVIQLHSNQSPPTNPGDRTFFEAVARMFGTIVEHRRAVDALRESEDEYRSLFENAPAALWVEDFSEVKRFLNQLRENGVDDLETYFKDHPGELAACAARVQVIDVNQRAIELYQAPDKASLLQGLSQIVTPQSMGALVNELVAIDAGMTRSTTEIENRTLTGEKRQLVMQWFVAPGYEADYARVFLSFLDVSETRVLEAQLLQAQKMESIGTLAGGIAHDFNNIMQAISGYTQLMLWDRDPEDPDYNNLRAIEKAANRASKLTRQLLTFSREVPSRLKPVDLNVEVEAMRAILERTIPKMIRIECRLAPDLCTINADRSQIEQAMMNLGINASHAMPDGGQLVFETHNVELDRAYCRAHPEAQEGPHVLLSIADTGHGMDAGTMQRMFDPFFTTREIGEGSGLGLAMIYGIVKNHNGHITCDSAPGGGTCFKVYIPAVRQARSAARPSAQAESRSFTTSGSETILVVDDEAVILDLAETILGRFGYRVIRAENGEQALDVMARKGDHVDLVILDLNMPGMGGNSCLQTLKKRHPGVPVLVASGYSPDGSAHETVAAGAAGFIGKPFQIKDMLKAVRDIFDTR